MCKLFIASRYSVKVVDNEEVGSTVMTHLPLCVRGGQQQLQSEYYFLSMESVSN